MKIGILGTGNIGKTLVQRLSTAGHEVKVANSRGPETISGDILSTGAHAVEAKDAVLDVDIVILSTPFMAIKDIAPLFADVSADTVVIDTSNYYPHRDGTIQSIEDGQTESEWVAEQLGRPIVKAWNAIGFGAFAEKAQPAGHPERIAIPVSADGTKERDIGMAIVEETGLDAVYAGTLKESWRQQPGSPCYCTDLSSEEMPAALAATERARLPKRRDIAIDAIMERAGDGHFPGPEYIKHLTRVLFM